VFAQSIPQLRQRIYKLIDWTGKEGLREQVTEVEEAIWTAADNPLTNWTVDDLQEALAEAGWQVSLTIDSVIEERRLAKALLQRWFQEDNAYFCCWIIRPGTGSNSEPVQSPTGE
jgi:hypothetical protein